MNQDNQKKNDAPKDGETLAEEIKDLQNAGAEQDPTDGRGMPGDGSGGATGPGGSSS
ncbi:hypothetical protein Poly30_13100 [Planctomycetes bacterium Poly30]|uniref:Uncharacterized protein n=1 Tax=Saltatorellus ferox TaxID=2528018 RepID=A0A518ENZ3_9BACT|nr:hypothetical protein Poly30_13100 [Planctomycetes bacterium Poly30]